MQALVQDLLEIFIESMMNAERREYLYEEGPTGNKCNGYRPGRTYGQGRTLTFRIPRDRYGNFHPQILAILRRQEDECERLAGTLYTKGLTQEQVGDVFRTGERDYDFDTAWARWQRFCDKWGKHYPRIKRRGEDAVILLMGATAMDKKSYYRQVPRIDLDKQLFPGE